MNKYTKLGMMMGLFVCLAISMMVMASAEYLPQQQDTAFTLTITSNNATACNLSSIQYSNGTSNLFNLALTKDGQTFYKTIDATNYTELGTTCHFISCTDGVTQETGSVCREVTPTGTNLSNSQGMVYIVFLIASLFFLTITIYGAVKIKWKPDRNEDGKIINVNKIRYFKPVLFSFAYIELMWISGILYSISFNFLSYDNVSNLFNWMYNIMLALLIPIAICTLFFTLIVFFQDKSLRKKIFRGYNR